MVRSLTPTLSVGWSSFGTVVDKGKEALPTVPGVFGGGHVHASHRVFPPTEVTLGPRESRPGSPLGLNGSGKGRNRSQRGQGLTSSPPALLGTQRDGDDSKVVHGHQNLSG